MKRLDPENLYIEFRDNATLTDPIISRKYSLTHSDITGDLFLTIGDNYAFDKINPMRDEVFAEWRKNKSNKYILYVYLYVGWPNNFKKSAIRFNIFKRELPLALEAIRYGDSSFFKTHPDLDSAPIWVYFDSNFAQFNRIQNWGTPLNYC